MRERPSPPRAYASHEGYPSLAEVRLSRRGFLGQAISAAAAAAGTLVLSAPTAEARRWRDSRTKVTIDLNGTWVFSGTNLRPEKVDLYVTDRRMATYLKRHRHDASLRGVVQRVVKRSKAAALFDGHKLLRLERRIGAAVARHYRHATGRRARRPDVQLHVQHHYQVRALGSPIRVVRSIRIIRGLPPRP